MGKAGTRPEETEGPQNDVTEVSGSFEVNPASDLTTAAEVDPASDLPSAPEVSLSIVDGNVRDLVADSECCKLPSEKGCASNGIRVTSMESGVTIVTNVAARARSSVALLRSVDVPVFTDVITDATDSKGGAVAVRLLFERSSNSVGVGKFGDPDEVGV